MSIDLNILSFILVNTFYNCYLHPVKLIIIYKKLIFDDFDTIQEYCDDNEIEKDIIIDQIKKLEWNSIVIPNINKIIVNLEHTNKLISCGHFLEFKKSEFKYEKKCNNGATLLDLTECFYRMKPNKYDYDHDSPCTPKIEIKDDVVIMKCSFC